jgi:hypothetical protein
LLRAAVVLLLVEVVEEVVLPAELLILILDINLINSLLRIMDPQQGHLLLLEDRSALMFYV